MTQTPAISATARRLRWAAFAAGPAAAVYALLPAELRGGDGALLATLSPQGRMVMAMAAWMSVWWLSEAVELEATSLLPLVLLPALGVMDIRRAAGPYADPTIFFFMGGMMLGAAMERWGLHRRLALRVVLFVGTSPRRLVGGLMLATALLSFLINNTACAVVMLPIGLSLVSLVRSRVGDDPRVSAFASAVVLGIGYAATIGGVATLVGTAPNLNLAAFIEREHGERLSFPGYLWVGVPIVVIFLPLSWVVLTRVAFRVTLPEVSGAREAVREQLRELGPMTRGEWIVLGVFASAIAAWLTIPLLPREWSFVGRLPTEAGVGIAAAVVLFCIPVDVRTRTFALDWKTAGSIHWGVLLLFGGGLSLAAAISATGVDAFIGALFTGLSGAHPWLVIAGVSTTVTSVSEVASNTAVTTTFLPITNAGAATLGLHPYLLLFPTALSASYAFMMPMGTPPSALAFATGRVTIREMCRAGIILNVLGIVLISTLVYWAGPWLLGLPSAVSGGGG